MIRRFAVTLRDVFRNPGYVVLALATASVVLVMALWLPNLALVRDIAFSATVPLDAKLRVLFGLIGSIATNYTPMVAAALVTASLLFGANLSLFIRSVSERRKSVGAGGPGFLASLGGLATSLVGIGCASCGIFILGPLLALVGGGSMLLALPLGGAEFIFLGIGLLAVSLWLQARALESPAACLPKVSSRIFRTREDG